MATGVSSWSKTAANNATADSSAQWPEGMPPSQVNDSARGMMASVAKWRDDISGALATSGTAAAYTIFSGQGFASLSALDGAVLAFTPHATNLDSPTLSVDGLTAYPVRAAHGVNLGPGVLLQGTPYVVIFSNSNSEFVLHGSGSSAYGIPLAAGMDYWGSTTPSSIFAFPIGQALSRTVYAPLYNIMGTSYGAGDGSTTFNVPDKGERVSVMKVATASRLTSTYFGDDSTKLGATGGSESKVLITANLPPYTPSGSIGNGAITSSVSGGVYGGSAPGGQGGNGPRNDFPFANAAITVSSSQATSTFTGNVQGGNSTPVAICQPTIVCNYIIRVI